MTMRKILAVAALIAMLAAAPASSLGTRTNDSLVALFNYHHGDGTPGCMELGDFRFVQLNSINYWYDAETHAYGTVQIQIEMEEGDCTLNGIPLPADAGTNTMWCNVYSQYRLGASFSNFECLASTDIFDNAGNVIGKISTRLDWSYDHLTSFMPSASFYHQYWINGDPSQAVSISGTIRATSLIDCLESLLP